ncbi:AraC family transcriptional regulator [Rivibacter subsaxonicus]|uniref:AraC-like DNA-binding protein n=1 Tax=Rivibacter subsaxonicus TaxID=457575 RepID=A0A4Q7W1J4_9BURK|nr:helix-turn-helix domain-containing protein [Rivibacter subsaxonicus]RZU02778.1 AraC-like DNA-binding protein [Rivibacter subsaxonicus]
MYLQRRPAAPLDAVVACLWASERGALVHARERILPSGCDSVVIALHEAPLRRFADIDDRCGNSIGNALWQGVHDAPVLRDTSAPACVVGISFRAGGAAALAGVPMGELAGRTVALDALWGSAVARLRERLQDTAGAAARLDLLEAWLYRRLASARPGDPVVAQALALFASMPTRAEVGPVQLAVGCSPQRFVARFRDAVGLTPKRYARVLRFHTLVQRLAAVDDAGLAELALDGGYVDQSHLSNEFRRLGGLTPMAYRPVAGDRPTHVAIGG